VSHWRIYRLYMSGQILGLHMNYWLFILSFHLRVLKQTFLRYRLGLSKTTLNMIPLRTFWWAYGLFVYADADIAVWILSNWEFYTNWHALDAFIFRKIFVFILFFFLFGTLALISIFFLLIKVWLYYTASVAPFPSSF